MKRFLLFLILIALLVCCTTSLGEKANTYGDFEYYLLPNGDAELSRYLGKNGIVVIYNDLEGHPITAVSRNPFNYTNYRSEDEIKNCTVIVAVDHPYLATIDGVLFGTTDKKLIYCPVFVSGKYTIPDGIQLVENYAFSYCSYLTDVIVPQSVNSIGESAFRECKNLSSISLPDSISTIGSSAFYNCHGLTNVAIPANIKKIEDFVFHGCTNLSSVIIPDGVTEIGEYAFSGCDSLQSVDIPNSVTSIGKSAFSGCNSLVSVTIPSSVTSIAGNAFAQCSNLTYVEIPESVASIGLNAFGTDDSKENKLVAKVTPGSYAESWCQKNKVQYVLSDTTYADRTDWLQ